MNNFELPDEKHTIKMVNKIGNNNDPKSNNSSAPPRDEKKDEKQADKERQAAKEQSIKYKQKGMQRH